MEWVSGGLSDVPSVRNFVEWLIRQDPSVLDQLKLQSVESNPSESRGFAEAVLLGRVLSWVTQARGMQWVLMYLDDETESVGTEAMDESSQEDSSQPL